MSFQSRANLTASLLFIPLAMLVTALISYYDEGRRLLYHGFFDFIFQGGVALNDLLVWTGFFTLVWLALFNYQLRYPGLERKIGRRILVALALTPAVALIGVLFFLSVAMIVQLTVGFF